MFLTVFAVSDESAIRSVSFEAAVCSASTHPPNKNRQASEKHDCIYLPSLRDPVQRLHMITRRQKRKHLQPTY